LTPRNYIEDPDEGDQIEIYANLNEASLIFNFDGEQLALKYTSLE
jgi:hypothetical protein